MKTLKIIDKKHHYIEMILSNRMQPNTNQQLQIEPIFLLESNLYIKCFCQPEYCQYKILTNSPFGHSGTKITGPVSKYILGPKIKNTPPFYLKRTKGKHSIREKPQLQKFKRTRIIVKCLIKSSNQHK
jgi:hypothetical protein